MQLSGWMHQILLRFRAIRNRKDPVICLRVFNHSRNTILADCVEVAGNGARRRKGLLGRERPFPRTGFVDSAL